MTRLLMAGLTCALAGYAAELIHKVPPKYPPAAKIRGIEGLVTVETDIDARGMVADARVLAGPAELRRAALESVLGWLFSPSASGQRTTVEVEFRLKPSGLPVLGVLKGVEFEGLTPDLEARARALVPASPGDLLPGDAMDLIRQAIADIKPPLAAYLTAGNVLRVEAAPQQIRVGGNAQSAKMRKKVAPVYPAEAKQQRIQGTVRLEATIDREGNIYRLDLVNGHPLLADAAIPAVRQWQYEPTLLNGQPVAVLTYIDVNFTLAK